MTAKNRSLALTGTFAAGLAAAFVAGRMTRPDGAEGATAKGADGALPTKVSSRDGGGDAGAPRRLADRRASKDGKEVKTGPTDAISRMEELMRTADPLERTSAWLEFVNSIDPSEFESVVASFRALGMTDSRMGEYSVLLSAWAKKDPLQALEYAQAHTGNPFARNTILTTWAGYDPEGAIRWANEHHEGDGGNPWMIGVIRGLAASDPVRASQLLAGMPFSEERGEALGALLPSILSQGADAARLWAEGISDEMLKEGAIARVAEALAAKDPAGTADWLARNPGDAADRSMDNVISAWMDTDQDSAIAYYKNLPTGDTRTNALRGVANSMALEDPKAAANFIDANAADADDKVYQQFVWHSYGEAPEIAANYIGKLSDTREQERMYQRVLDGWLRRDFQAASNWIGSNPLPEGVQQRLQRRMQDLQQRQQ